MSERETAIEDMNDIVRGFIKLMALPFSGTLDELLIENMPKTYAEPAEHFINARIEFLTGIKSLADMRIERLQAVREKVRERAKEATKKEKVQVD